MEKENNTEQTNVDVSSDSYYIDSNRKNKDFWMGFILAVFGLITLHGESFSVILGPILLIILAILFVMFHRKFIAYGILSTMITFIVFFVVIAFIFTNGFTCRSCFG